jgi:hypothetical protein
MPRNEFENHEEDDRSDWIEWDIDNNVPVEPITEVPTTVPQEDLRGLWEKEDRVIDAIKRRQMNAQRMMEEDRKRFLGKEPQE